MNGYEYCDGNPLMNVDPSGLDSWDDAANFFGGWGHSLTYGATGWAAQSINRALGYGEFEYGGGYFTAGCAVGAIHSLAITGAGGYAAFAKSTPLMIPTWQGAEQLLLAKFGGAAQYAFKVGGGTRRVVDVLADRVAHEAKWGFVKMSPRIRAQIIADAALLNNGDVRRVEWHFFTSPVTGRGASKSVISALRAAGIRVTYH